jgi:hypothetical protein
MPHNQSECPLPPTLSPRTCSLSSTSPFTCIPYIYGVLHTHFLLPYITPLLLRKSNLCLTLLSTATAQFTMYRPSSHSCISAFRPHANADEDWTKISDLKARWRIQNRIAQRNYRAFSCRSTPTLTTPVQSTNDTYRQKAESTSGRLRVPCGIFSLTRRLTHRASGTSQSCT